MRLLRVFVPLALIALCLWLSDGRAVLERLSGLSVGWFIGAVVLLNAVTLLSALRWKLTATALKLPLSAGEAVREYYLAQFVNQTLPGGVLGDAARVVRSRKGGPMRRAAQAVVLERASGQAGMALVAVLGLLLLVVAPQRVLPAASALPAVAWLPLAFLVALLIGVVPLALGRAGGREDGWRRAVREALLRRWPVQTALSLLVALLTVAGFVLAARATGSALAPTTALLIVPLILTSIICGVSGLGASGNMGSLGGKTFVYYTVSSLLAILTGLVLVNLLQPGVGVDLGLEKEPENLASSIERFGSSPWQALIRLVTDMVPTNPIASMADDIVFAVYIPPQAPDPGHAFFTIFLNSVSSISPDVLCPNASNALTISSFLSLWNPGLIVPP